jgi:hypothetical protein
LATVQRELVRYDAMCRAIAEAYKVDEVKDIRDKALAIEMYARQANNTDAETQACEIRLRAERKAGQLLKEIEKAKGGRPSQTTRPTRGVSAKTLADYGISHDQSAQWQKLADVPDDQFEASLAKPKPTTSGIISAWSPVAKRDERALWLWGRLQDFERDGLLAVDPNWLFDMMSDHMKETTLRLAPQVADWLRRLTDE